MFIFRTLAEFPSRMFGKHILRMNVKLTYLLSFSGLNNFNVDYVARSISAVVKATTSN
jgi:hypothetical protein